MSNRLRLAAGCRFDSSQVVEVLLAIELKPH